jgi:hypothetical protein
MSAYGGAHADAGGIESKLSVIGVSRTAGIRPMHSGGSYAARFRQLCTINFHENAGDSLTALVITLSRREIVAFATERCRPLK